jgi:very-short-patch-repair endonuclease
MQDETQGVPVVAVEIDYDSHVNYAMQQNSVPVVKTIRILNDGAVDLDDLRVEIRAEPGLAEPLRFTIARIPAGSFHVLSEVDLRFSAVRLVNQEEREQGELRIEVSRGDHSFVQRSWPLDVLSYGEWAGSGSLPEILAAFVQPNHPEVARLLATARNHLETNTGQPSITGYETRSPAYAREVVRAIYEAVCGRDLTYILPPASFESTGQKIRTPDQIVDLRMGTCLDLTLFLAAALEQAGLHPLLILVEEHAFVGAWLTDDCFVDATIDDSARIRKRLALDEILVVEATGVSSRPQLSFDEAVLAAARHLETPDTFAYAVDVRAARKVRIRPISKRALEGTYVPVPIAPAVPTDEVQDVAPVEDLPVPDEDPEVVETPSSRVERWKRKLLDLTLRNRFLNYRDTQKTVPLLCPDIAGFEDLLSAGRTFAVQPEPKLMSDDDPRDAELHRRTTGDDALDEYLRDQLRDGQVHTSLGPEDLEKRLVQIHREARVILEEGGANALYLAVGFLRWYETDGSDLERRAPILLLPLEVSRDVVHAAFRMKLADEDPRANVTLLQKLETDYGIKIPELARLETDESGLDVKKILDHVRRAVLVSPRWDVTEDVALGLFSFTKHLMWLDLEEHADRLMENDVVRHLIDKPECEFEPGAQFPDPATLDRERSPAETFCPLDADSTQLGAIHAASDGRTFVLEGPPGTGKSQTITNLVSHALATGRRVLFVSAKMAALNVVHDRLSRIGLGAFCLEIHSNKAQKRKVLDQIQSALDVTTCGGVDDWERSTEALKRVRTNLNDYVEVLHRPRSFGRGAFHGIARLIGLGEEDRLALDFGEVDAVDAGRLHAAREAIERVCVLLEEIGAPAEHPWRAARTEEWLPTLASRIEDATRRLGETATELELCANAWAEVVGHARDGLSRRSMDDLETLGELLESSPNPDGSLLSEPGWPEVVSRVEDWARRGARHIEIDAGLRTVYRDELASLDLDGLRARLEAAGKTFWPFSWLKARAPRRALEDLRIAGRRPSNEKLIRDLDTAIERRRIERELADIDGEAKALLGRHWNGLKTDWEEVALLLTWAARFRPLVVRVAGDDVDTLLRIRARWIRLATEARPLFVTGGALSAKLGAFRAAREACAAAREEMADIVDLDVDVAYGDPEEADFAAMLIDLARVWVNGIPRLRSWCAFRRARRQVVENGLGALVEAVEDGTVATDRLDGVFERSFYQWWVERLFEDEPRLREFNGAEHRDRIRRFRELDLAVTAKTPDLVRSRLSDRVPRSTPEMSSSSTSEMGTLQRELMKKRRHMPIRRLFEKIPNVLSRLKPCLLMSPLSVAQYLSLDFPTFDLVVFDEASQIPVWDAIGAIRRGENLIVVGDSKQLPPTTFFERADDENLDEDDIEEMESILDECIAARLPRLHLGWHYRSRHESLIAFSNARYYENSLLTFPSPARDTDDLGLTWRYLPEARYDRGRSRTNRGEAEAVVEEIVRRLTDPVLCEDSIGVVTFSSPQQTLIEDLLDRARREHPEIDPWFGGDVDEPVFVKNLENVQGDERNVILFSICYGPDANGRIAMNFGPVNRDGGERRLNVAVTRARKQVIVFSSLRSEQIDLARTSSVGVKHLKEYLEYAEKGTSVLAQALVVDGDAETESPFEEAVCRALWERGFEVVPQVGCSGYRIDLGVKDPDAPGRFLLGIECDGAMYHSGKTARDRDRLRAAVLVNLGWRLHRIWSTDWWQDPEGELRKVEEEIERALRERDVEPVAEEEPEEPESEEQGIEESDDAPVPPLSETPVPAGTPYEETPSFVKLGAQDDFHEPEATERIREVMRAVLAHEAPVSLELFTRRVAAPWGHTRLTARLTDRVTEALPPDEFRQIRGTSEEFLWRADQDPETYEGFRVPAPDGQGERQPEDIPPEEYANAALMVLRGHVAMSLTDLSRETARAFGFHRLGSKLTECTEDGIRALCSGDEANLEGEEVTLA